jgi:hypothetical protein
MEEWMTKYPSWNQFVMRTYNSRFEELLKTIDGIAFRKVDERLNLFALWGNYESVVDYSAGVSLRDWPGTLDRALALDFDLVIPGHSGVTDRAMIVGYQDYLVRIQQMVREMTGQGRPREDIQAMLQSEFNWGGLSMGTGHDGVILEMGSQAGGRGRPGGAGGRPGGAGGRAGGAGGPPALPGVEPAAQGSGPGSPPHCSARLRAYRRSRGTCSASSAIERRSKSRRCSSSPIAASTPASSR